MSYSQARRTSLYEFNHLQEAARRNQQNRLAMLRQLGVWVLSPHTKRPLHPEDLIRLDSDKTKTVILTPEQVQADIAQKIKAFKDGHSKTSGKNRNGSNRAD